MSLPPRAAVAANAPEDTVFWDATAQVPPLGLDYLHPEHQIDKSHMFDCQNVWIDKGVTRSRYGTAAFGDSIADLMAVVNFINGAGIAWMVRFTTAKIQLWDGAAWNDYYTGLTGSATDYFTFTSFADKLLFSNGVDGLIEIDFDLDTTTVIAGAPSCKFLTTFDGRVIASNITRPDSLPSRLKWSVKNNSHDWTGLGSGFEDLLSTPGGAIDQAEGCWPITDDTMLVLRDRSTWMARVSGVLDAPFAFSRLYDKLGTIAPRSIDSVPGAIVGKFSDDFYVMSHQELKRIAFAQFKRINAETTDNAAAVGMYDTLTRNYWFSNQTNAYRFSFDDQAWTRHQYPFGIKHMMATKSSFTGLTIDGLDDISATIDGLDAFFSTIDSMIGDLEVLGNFFVSDGAPGYVIHEDASLTNDADGAGGTVDSSIEVITGSVRSDPRHRLLVYKTEITCEETATRDITVSYSADNGNTWTTYGTISLSPTTGPTPFVTRNTINVSKALMKLSSPVLGQLNLQALYLQTQQGDNINL